MTRAPRSFATVSALLFGLALGGPARAAAYCQMTTVAPNPLQGACSTTGEPLEWRRRCIEYALDMRGASDLELDDVSDIVAGSFGTWLLAECDGEAPGFSVRESEFLASCRRAGYDPGGGNVNVVAFVPELDDGPILALTTVWYHPSTGEIFDADIIVNESQGPYADCPALGCGGAFPPHDLANVLTHEVGHFFGLAHSQDLDATMYASSGAGEVKKRSLEPDDVAGLCATYGDAALPAECDYTPRGGRALSCEGRSRGCDVGAIASGEDAGAAPAALAFLGVAAAFITLGRRLAARGRGRAVGRRADAAREPGSDTLRPRE